MASPLRTRLRDRLTEAMRARDRRTAGAIRSVLAALENSEAVQPAAEPEGVAPADMSEHVAGAADGVGAAEAARRTLTSDDERAVVECEIAELRSSAEALSRAGQQERSSELARAAETIEALLEA